jgi:hypothetical protein
MAAGHAAELGYVGGYLLTTARGRPLEFHYTTPVRPTATHRILYGAELEKYIYGELIAANLARQTTLETSFLITDQPLILSQRDGWSCPIVCVVAASRQDAASVSLASTQVPDSLDAGAPAQEVAADDTPRSDLIAATGFDADLDALNRWLAETNPGLNLSEPFIRVWQALDELLQASMKSAA